MIPHVGGVIIGDNVRVGALSTIDRASIDYTIIGDYSKIDDRVHIAHNSVVGQRCILCASASIGGSVTIGDDCWLGMGCNIKQKVIIADGTKIVGAKRSRNAINIWTDNALWSMTFVGPPFVFNFSQLGTNCGLIAQHAGVDYDGRAVWMGYDNFYVFDGQVRSLDLSLIHI